MKTEIKIETIKRLKVNGNYYRFPGNAAKYLANRMCARVVHRYYARNGKTGCSRRWYAASKRTVRRLTKILKAKMDAA